MAKEFLCFIGLSSIEQQNTMGLWFERSFPMSFALLALSVCTFALGFAEFVAVSLVPSVAANLHLSVGSVGMMIGIYAIGVSIGAPTLSALLARAPRRGVLAVSMLVFAVGNIVTALSPSLPMLLTSRFVSGLMHGVVIALASSTAAAAVGPEKSGKAIATVFAGLTVALMIGVPVGTYAGGHFHWQYVFVAIAVIGAFSSIALMVFTPAIQLTDASEPDQAPSHNRRVAATVLNTKILHPVLTTAFAYAASFTGFTYISVLLGKLTHLGATGITGMFVLYGVFAAIGNALGGRYVDRFGSKTATLTVLAGLFLALMGAYLGAASVAAMACVMVVWGIASFGAVPILQNTVLMVARHHPEASPEVASGMNIAAFNIGIAMGSVLGAMASQYSAAAPMLLGLLPLVFAGLLAMQFDAKPSVGSTRAVSPSLNA